MDNEKFWGYHLILDCRSCNSNVKYPNGQMISRFAGELVKAIDMVAYGEPQVVHFGTGNKGGYTLIQLIETSNISGHFCDETGDCYIDVFSCKSYDPEIVKQIVNQYFDPVSIRTTFLNRQA